MAVTQELLVRALDYVTQRPGIQLESLTPTRSAHLRSVNDLFENRNIVAVGISAKHDAGAELALCFYVKKKHARSRLSGDSMIQPVINMPNDQAVFTDVKEIGELRPQILAQAAPLQSGYSISHSGIDGTGTLGAIVRKDGRHFVLSNSHVLARNGLANAGDAIVYPGTLDGGRLPRNLAAHLAEFVPFVPFDPDDPARQFVNRCDAALGEVAPGRLARIDWAIHAAAMPPKTGVARRGMVVEKLGRTTRATRGTVVDANFRVILDYAGVGRVAFLDQVYCSRYTEPGDSGALVVDADSGRIVGLHFAGGSAASVFSPIDAVVAELGFEFVTATP